MSIDSPFCRKISSCSAAPLRPMGTVAGLGRRSVRLPLRRRPVRIAEATGALFLPPLERGNVPKWADLAPPFLWEHDPRVPQTSIEQPRVPKMNSFPTKQLF